MNEEIVRFTIPGNPVTKKTHQRILRVGGYPRIFPSKQYEEYEKYCKPFCLDIWKNKGNSPVKQGVAIKIIGQIMILKLEKENIGFKV